jgi:hypothetical protein
VRAGRGPRRRRAGDRAAVADAVGRGRPLARPDAPRPDQRQRTGRDDGGRPDAAGARDRGPAGVAQLRGVPVGVRGRGQDRGRPGAAGLASAAAVHVPVVSARVAVPLERQVPAGVGAAVPVLRGCARLRQGRAGLGHRRGLPRGAEPADAAAPGQQPAGRRRFGRRRPGGRRGGRRRRRVAVAVGGPRPGYRPVGPDRGPTGAPRGAAGLGRRPVPPGRHEDPRLRRRADRPRAARPRGGLGGAGRRRRPGGAGPTTRGACGRAATCR